MVWQRRLRTASFRNVRFEIQSSEDARGRRVVTHEFVNRDLPYSEDMGRKARQFTIEGFIVGFDYLRQRDRLIEALEDERKPGELVHPYYGNIQVNCTGFTVRQSGRDGGSASFSMTFVEAGSLSYPNVTKDQRTLLELLGLGGVQAALDSFTNTFSTDGFPEYVRENASDKVSGLLDSIEAQTDFINRSSDDIADLAYEIQNMRDDLDEIINTPAILGERLNSSLSLLKSATFSKRESVSAYRNLFTFGDDDEFMGFDTASRAQLMTNSIALNRLTRVIAVMNAATQAIDIEWDSEEDATDTRQALLDEIDRLSGELGDDDPDSQQYQSLQDIRASLAEAVPPEDEQLPSIYQFFHPVTETSLELTYSLYGDLVLEDDIISRNHVRNPAFVPGGVTLQAKTNV
jgi:prophage DNA circulation protein